MARVRKRCMITCPQNYCGWKIDKLWSWSYVWFFLLLFNSELGRLGGKIPVDTPKSFLLSEGKLFHDVVWCIWHSLPVVFLVSVNKKHDGWFCKLDVNCVIFMCNIIIIIIIIISHQDGVGYGAKLDERFDLAVNMTSTLSRLILTFVAKKTMEYGRDIGVCHNSKRPVGILQIVLH